MAKYMICGSYTVDGKKGLIKDGGVKRRDIVENLIREQGGQVESFNFAFGSCDLYVIAEFPDNINIAALSLDVGAGGALDFQTVVLITPEELDLAIEKGSNYHPGETHS